MNEMIERVKLALDSERDKICEILDQDGKFEIGEIGERLARTAIEAMREPTEAMVDKGESSLICGPEPRDLEDAPSMKWAHAKSCWRAMIDAALKE